MIYFAGAIVAVGATIIAGSQSARGEPRDGCCSHMLESHWLLGKLLPIIIGGTLYGANLLSMKQLLWSYYNAIVVATIVGITSKHVFDWHVSGHHLPALG